MAEWSKAADLRSVGRIASTWVRTPLIPIHSLYKFYIEKYYKMKYIQLSHILFKLTKKYDIFGKEELYILLSTKTHKYKVNLNSLDNNIWEYKDTIYIPYCDSIIFDIYDKDIAYDDVVQKEEFNIGDIKSKNNLTIEYEIVEVIDSVIYQEDKDNLLSELNFLSVQNDRKDIINKTLKDKNKKLNLCIRVYEIKIKELENKNSVLNIMKDKIGEIIN